MVFTIRLHVCNARYCQGLSVHLSVKHVLCDKTKDICAHIFIPHERSFILVYRHEEWLVGATPST